MHKCYYCFIIFYTVYLYGCSCFPTAHKDDLVTYEYNDPYSGREYDLYHHGRSFPSQLEAIYMLGLDLAFEPCIWIVDYLRVPFDSKMRTTMQRSYFGYASPIIGVLPLVGWRFRATGFKSEVLIPHDTQNNVSHGRYQVLENGVISDTWTGLQWYTGPDQDMTWDEAESWVKSLKVAGGGWRMPTLEELRGLYQKGKEPRNMDPVFKPSGWSVWSGELDTISSYAWYFDFNSRSKSYATRSYSCNRVFAARVGR